MTDDPGGPVESGGAPLLKPLPGYIFYENKSGNTYGKYFKSTYVKDGKIYHDSEHLGKVIDKELGLFRNRKRGYFTFNLKDGYGAPPGHINPEILTYPKLKSLDFGDIWMVDQVLKQTGLETVLDNLIPGSKDTLKSLISYRLLEPDAYIYAKDWHSHSYAKILYPNALLDSPRISEFHALLGNEEHYTQFFKSYLQVIAQTASIQDQISFPVLLDSTGLPNDIETHLTAVNNHNGLISNEIRLIYVIDQRTKLPIFFRYICGNIIDNSTLINTLNHLMAHGIKIEIVIMDAGYASMNNLSELARAGIGFLTRMPQHRKEFKQLIDEHGSDLLSLPYSVTYGKRAFFCKKVPVRLYDYDMYAFLLYDVQKCADDTTRLIFQFEEESDKIDKHNAKYPSAGRFALLTSNDYSAKEILPLYYTRQAIEETFDVSKTYASILPLRGHSEDTIRGILLVSFIATIVYSSINHGLATTKITAKAAINKLHHLKITVYDTAQILEELTKEQKEVFKQLQLDCPFQAETGNDMLKKDSFLTLLKSEKRARGRPKSIKANEESVASQGNQTLSPEERRGRGRPKGAKTRRRRSRAYMLRPHMENGGGVDLKAVKTKKGEPWKQTPLHSTKNG